MKKKPVIAIVVIVLLAGGIFILFNLTGGRLSGSRDTFSSNITYRDEARQIPISVDFSYETAHAKTESYLIKTDSSGMVPIAYDAEIQNGKVFLQIMQEGKTVEAYPLENGSQKFTVNLQPEAEYSLCIAIENGKGNIHLRWMELV